MAVLGPCCCTDFPLVVASRGCSLVAVRGLFIVFASLITEHTLWGAWASVVVACGLVAETQCLWVTGLVAPWAGGIFLDEGLNPSRSPALAAGFFTTEPPGKPEFHLYFHDLMQSPLNQKMHLSNLVIFEKDID